MHLAVSSNVPNFPPASPSAPLLLAHGCACCSPPPPPPPAPQRAPQTPAAAPPAPPTPTVAHAQLHAIGHHSYGYIRAQQPCAGWLWCGCPQACGYQTVSSMQPGTSWMLTSVLLATMPACASPLSSATLTHLSELGVPEGDALL